MKQKEQNITKQLTFGGVSLFQYKKAMKMVDRYNNAVLNTKTTRRFLDGALVVLLVNGPVSQMLKAIQERYFKEKGMKKGEDLQPEKANQDGACAEETGEEPTPAPSQEEEDTNNM